MSRVSTPTAAARPTGRGSIPRVRVSDRLGGVFAFRRDPIGFLTESLRRYGDVFQFRPLGVPMVMVNHPDHIQRVLVDNHANYDKDSILYRVVRPVLRNGLIGNPGGEFLRRQRRLMQPAFHRPNVAAFAANMTDETAEMLRRWESGPGPGAVVNVTEDVGYLALRIVNRSMFSARIGPAALAFEQSFAAANQVLGAFFRFPFPPLTVPTPAHRRLRAAIAGMDAFVSEMIAERLAGRGESADLLSMLMNAVDPETGEGMTVEQLHHEVLNVVVGAYETTTNAMSWAFYLLARHPEVERRLHAEVDGVLGARVPDFADLPRLRYTRMVVEETLRLYSPAWQTMRRARSADVLGGFHVPADTNIYLNSYTLHRHPEFWPDPERFEPERFTAAAVAARPRHVYLPFGSGPRVCIGKHFALTELQLVLATVARSHRLVFPAGVPPVEIEPLITLHPRNGVRLRLERR